MQDNPAQAESKNEFFQRLLRQGQGTGSNASTFQAPMPMNRNGPIEQPRRSPSDLDPNLPSMMPRMNRPQPQHSRSQPSDPRFPPFDLPPPPPQGAPWMHPPPGFSPHNNRFLFPGPPLSPGLPPPPGGFGPPPPGMMPYGGAPPPGFGRGVYSPPPPPPPPGQDGWHPPPGFGGGYYQEGDGRER